MTHPKHYYKGHSIHKREETEQPRGDMLHGNVQTETDEDRQIYLKPLQ